MIWEFIYRFGSSLFAFLFVIGVAIFIHELGHFLFAKRYGVRVYTFSLGFGKTIWSRVYGETEYRLAWIPMGGYVKMSGEDPSEARTGASDEFASKPVWQRAAIIVAGPLANILLGFALAVGLYLHGLESPGFVNRIGIIAENSPVLSAGLRVGDVIEAVEGAPVSSWFEIERIERASEGKPLRLSVLRDTARFETTVVPGRLEFPAELDALSRLQLDIDVALVGGGTLEMAAWWDPVIGEMKEDGAARKAGLMPGDRILSIADTPIVQWFDVARTIRTLPLPDTRLVLRDRWWKGVAPAWSTDVLGHFWPETAIVRDTIPGVTVEFMRGGETQTLAVLPQIGHSQRGDGSIESFLAIGVSPVMKPEPRGLLHASISAVFMTVKMGKLIIATLDKLIRREISAKLLAGPLGIAQGSGSSFREGGFKQLVYFLALISVNLGVVNLIPFPLLDGGWLFIFLLYEALARRPMPQKIQERVMQAGLAGLLVLILFITYNDLGRMLGFQTVDEVVQSGQKK